MIATISVVFLHTSAGILDTRTIDDHTVNFLLACEKRLLEYAVPVFVLISGALFLNPKKNVTYQGLLSKNVRRIVLALVIFGLPMCFMEVFFTNHGSGVGVIPLVIQGFVNFITGQCWNHMFYLYMLIALYLLTPIIKPFCEKASNRDLLIAVILLFVCSSLLPTLNAYGISMKSYMIIGTPYVFIYLLGYVLAWRCNAVFWKKQVVWISLFVCSAVIIGIKNWFRIPSVLYIDPNLIIMACALFMFVKNQGWGSGVADRFGPYSFAIYIVHPVFINFAYKFIGINESVVYKPHCFLAFGGLFLLMSFAAAWILLKIPFLKKYVL